jgi:NADH-quinone oxidoreductase subunit L
MNTFWLLIAIPLASAAILLLLGRRADRWGHWLGVASIFAAFVLGLVYFFRLDDLPADERSAELTLFQFLHVGSLTVDFGLLFDPLSAVFVLLITGVGFLIHLYAVGYMADDPKRRTFFGYFNLFVAAMLLLVLGNNYVMLYLGWEGVGLASYLLIAFWYTRPAAATAGKKAFIMNRVGDVGLVIAIFLMFATLGTVNYTGVAEGVHNLSTGVTLALGLLLLIGACGKSGQFPLQAWLPDAMEGPTPVSALIHAATMVTAGVYLIARANPIFNANSTAQAFVVAVGALTLVIGCIIGCAKDDIKRVLAWSTVSQIGYMFLGVTRRCGVRAGHHPPARPRLLQGRALPRRRFGHARHERPGGHPPLRRAVEVHEDHLDHVRRGLARHHRTATTVRLLHQGADHRGGV